MRNIIVVVVLMAIIAWVNLTIYQKDSVLSQGRVVLLEIKPIDPRSLLQGDYMIFDYEIAKQALAGVTRNDLAKVDSKGAMVVRLDANNIASFDRFSSGGKLQGDEVLITYQKIGACNQLTCDDWKISVTPNTFFFQEGRDKIYANAKYVIARSDGKGGFMIEGLADELGHKIDPQAMDGSEIKIRNPVQ